MTPTDSDEDDHTAERADVAILHDLASAHNTDRYPPSGTPGLCQRHALPNTDGCPQCAAEDDEWRRVRDDLAGLTWSDLYELDHPQDDDDE